LPPKQYGDKWQVVLNTAVDDDNSIHEAEGTIKATGRSLIVLMKEENKSA
jgi:glycogen operon protein